MIEEGEKLSNGKKREIQEWFIRLSKTSEFQERQRSLAQMACGILQEGMESNAFKDLFIIQIKINNADCNDREAMAFNEIYLSWRLAQLEKES